MSTLRAKRLVTIVQAREGRQITHETSATTWGELREELRRDWQTDLQNNKVTVRETRNSLTLDTALLPETSFTLFAYPEKQKGGAKRIVKKVAKKSVKKSKKAAVKHKSSRKATKKTGISTISKKFAREARLYNPTY